MQQIFPAFIQPGFQPLPLIENSFMGNLDCGTPVGWIVIHRQQAVGAKRVDDIIHLFLVIHDGKQF